MKHNPIIVVVIVIFVVSVLGRDDAVAGDNMYTQGDVVNLRKGPNAKSRIVEKLHIGTSVTVNIRKGDWFWVDVNNESIASGWIKSDLLGENYPKITNLLNNYRKSPADQVKERCMWLGRANALEPLNIEVLELLHNCKIKEEDEQLAKNIKDKINYIRDPEKYQDMHEDKVVFLYLVNRIVPLTVLKDGLMIKPYNSNETRDQFISNYVKLGRRYNLLSNHGLAISTVQVAREPLVYFKNYDNCDRPLDINVKASGKPTSKINAGFATNFKVATEHRAYPENISAELVQLINTESETVIKRKKKRWDKELPVDISVFDIDHDGVPEFMSVKKYLHNIDSEMESSAGYFVVMLWKSGSNQTYAPVYTVIEGTSEKYAYLYVDSYNFVGIIDIDGDGVDELVTSIGQHEGFGYEVHTFKNGIWTKTNLLLYYGTC